MRLYLTRHGRTQWNKELRLQGSINEPLDQTGRLQAHELALHFKDLPFEQIYSSPLDRAKETASILNKYMQTTIVLEAALREASYGAAEGLTREEYHQQYADRISHVRGLPFPERIRSRVVPDGESTAEVAGRVLPFLTSLAQEWMGKNLLLVCHGGVIRAVLVSLFEWDDRKISIDNTGYVVLEYHQEGRFMLKETHRFAEENHDRSKQFTF